MPDQRFAILDPAAGISGDMLLGALVAAGAPADWLRGLPRRLGCPEVAIDIVPVRRCGIMATKVEVRLPRDRGEATAHDHAETAHAHGDWHGVGSHGPAPHGAHRHVGELIRMIESADLSPWVRDRALRAFQLLAEVEGRVHGIAPEEVALHEVGALDALIDIVGGIEGFERLNIRRIYHRPVSVGSGWVEAAHGAMPVPAPATALLLQGLEIVSNGPVMGEATTPTGAVLLRVLSAGAVPERWRPVHQGWGAGTRDPQQYPNALRLLIAESAVEAGEVVVLSTDLDDLSPEYLAPLQEALWEAGALDVQLWSTLMKKGRIGFRVEVITGRDHAEAVAQALFRHSTTAGIRRQTVERVTLPRRTIDVNMADGAVVRVKVLDGPDGLAMKPEYDDVVAVARRTGRSAHELAMEVHARAREILDGNRAE